MELKIAVTQKLHRSVIAGLCLAFANNAIAAVPDEKDLAFVACPIFRDTDLGCMLVRYEGELFAVNSPPPFAAEQGHKVLVEGTTAAGPDVCGGRPLRNLRLSVFQEMDPSCREILPAEGYRTPMPPAEMLFGLIAMLGQPLPQPAPPFQRTVFTVPFMFESSFMGQGFGSPEMQVEAAALYAVASNAQTVTVRVPTGTVLLTNGEYLVETHAILSARRNAITAALVALDVPEERIQIETAEPDFAVRTTRSRDVEIIVTP